MSSTIIETRDLKVYFTMRRSFMDEILRNRKDRVKAVDGINLSIEKGEIISLVGESGSGKTTVGRAMLSLVDITEGSVLFKGKKIPQGAGKKSRPFRQKAQMIFQDPYQSLNPRDIVLDIVGEPLMVHMPWKSVSEKKGEILRALGWAGLNPAGDYLYRFPHELSGGQRQRVAIAAALILQPEFIVADEPVSMLDVSIRADILRLLVNLRDTMGISCMCITHDLSLAWLISDRIAIMYLGKIMEIGKSDLIVDDPLHPYTRALLEVMPLLRGRKHPNRQILKGETPNPVNIPPGCRFHPRCPSAMDVCSHRQPDMVRIDTDHYVACHLVTAG